MKPVGVLNFGSENRSSGQACPVQEGLQVCSEVALSQLDSTTVFRFLNCLIRPAILTNEKSISLSVHSNESNFINECKTPNVLKGCQLTSKRTSYASCISFFSLFFLFFNVHR